jgi:hypothetical protein
MAPQVAPASAPLPSVAANRADWLARGALLSLVAVICAITWGRWGSLIVDCGREMYIPAALSQGKRLYSDLWYPYGPLIPYWHSLLFRVFGIHLSILYLVGVGIATTVALLLYSVSRAFIPVSLSFACSFTFIILAFQLTLFNYVLPYSYPAAYGILMLTGIVWLLARDPFSAGRARIALAGVLTSAALLTKIEMGGAGCVILAWAIVLRAFWSRSAREMLRDTLACLPPLLAAAAVYGWLVSRSSAAFIFADNIYVLPNSYFEREFGRAWAAATGFSLSPRILLASAVEGIGGSALLAAALALCSRSKFARRASLAVSGALCGLYVAARYENLVHGAPWPMAEAAPQFLFLNHGTAWMSAVLLVAIVVQGWRSRRVSRELAALSIFAVASLAVGARVMTYMRATGYPVFYGILAYVASIVALYFLTRDLRFSSHLWRGFAATMCCGTIALSCENYPVHLRSFQIGNGRGTIFTSARTGEAFAQTLKFVEDAKARGEGFVVWPEEAALYFFSGTNPPNRWWNVMPGTLPPGAKTDEYLADLDRQNIRYVILSNRATPEYGVPIFGADYDREIYAWLLTKFDPIRDIGPYQRTGSPDHWGVLIYERKSPGVRGDVAAISPVAAECHNPDPGCGKRRNWRRDARRG